MPVEYPDEEPLSLEMRHFLDCVESRDRPLTDGQSGFRVLQLLHAAQRSLVTNGSLVALPPE